MDETHKILKDLEKIFINNDLKMIKRAKLSKIKRYFIKKEYILDYNNKVKINSLIYYIEKMQNFINKVD